MIKSIKQSIAAYFASVNGQAPFLGYLGVAFWSAWILSTSGVQDWISSASGTESMFSAAYVETRTVLIVTLILCAALEAKLARLFEEKRALLAAALAAVAGDALLAASWLAPDAPAVLLHAGALLAGAGAAFLLMKAGVLYSALSPWRAMLLFMASQLIAACLYLIVTVAPLGVAVALFCLLPLASAVTFALIPAKGSHARGIAVPANLAPGFARLVVMVFAFRFCSNYIKTLLVAFQTSEAVELGIVGNILLKMLVALVFVCYAFNTSKNVDYGRVCYFLFVGASMILVVLPLFEDQAPLFYALNGTLSGLTGNIAFCIFAYICFQSKASPLRVFGLGYAAVLLGSLLGQVVGGHVGPSLIDEGLPSAPFLAVAYVLILLALLAFPPRQLDELTLPVDRADALDLARRPNGKADLTQAHCRIVAQRCGLTEREREVLELLASGHGRTYAANRLHVSVNTVRSHSRSIYSKLGVHSHAELMILLEQADDGTGRKEAHATRSF